MVIEGDYTVGDQYMTSSKTFARDSAFGIKSTQLRLLKIRPRKNVTGTVAEKDPVRQCPSTFRVFFTPGFILFMRWNLRG